MSLTWKDAAVTVGAVLVALVAIGLVMGFGDTIDGRWMYGSALLFAITGFTALLTGTASLMERIWTSVTTYVLSLAVVTITAVNIFTNSETWFIILASAIGLLWLEFIGVHLFTNTPGMHHPTSHRGATI